MAQYKFNCITDTTPPNTLTLNLPTDCANGSGWVIDSVWFTPLTLAEGAELTGAILLVWLAGWGARQVVRVIRR